MNRNHADQDRLFDVAAAIADGAPIDWAALPSGTLSEELLLPARIVERVARVHASLPPVESFRSSVSQAPLGSSLAGDDSAAAETPLTWGPLAIIEKIGQGTFGDVYRARDRTLNRIVALKLLRRKDFESPVIEEGHVMTRVRHPNVVTVYGAERIDGRIGIWMEFVDGHTLHEELNRRGPLSVGDLTDAGVQLSRALAAVHRAGLLHRDIKAQNAMRDADGRVVLTDFGTGRELSPHSDSKGRELAGTPLYLAPEVLGGSPSSVATDVYSLGVLLYYLGSGSFPVAGRSLAELRRNHEHGSVALRTRRPDLPRRLAGAIDRAIAADPARRFASAGELEAALLATRVRFSWMARWAAAAAVIVALTALLSWTPRPSSARLELQPRDSVLVAGFENRTGNPVFDGTIEYALARELGNSNVISVVPNERVFDALRLMKKPIDTRVDRAIGREICLRDGGIKALISGRIETSGTGYLLTAEISDPADGVVVASVRDLAPSAAAALQTVTREAARLRELLGERLDRIKGAPPVQQAATSSMVAFQLYGQARAAGQEGRLPDQERLLRLALAEDPNFASAWIRLALVLKWAQRDPEARDAAQRGAALAESSPEWERHWIRGTYSWIAGDYAKAIPEYEALVRLRPNHDEGANLLMQAYLALGKPEAALPARRLMADQRPLDIGANYEAAFAILRMREATDEARTYIDRLDALLAVGDATMPRFFLASQWRRMLPAYEAWRAGDLGRAARLVDREARRLHEWTGERWRMQTYIGNFYVTLGRLHDAERIFTEAQDFANLMVLADIRDDIPALRRHLLRLPPTTRVERLVKAGLIDRARAALDRPGGPPMVEVQKTIGRGALALAQGDRQSSIDLLRSAAAVARGWFASEYHTGCDLLATALVQSNRSHEAIAELEGCVAVPPRFVGLFNAGYWLKLRFRLADEYRAAGRAADAEAIEGDLRRLLVHADADHPLLTRLMARSRPAPDAICEALSCQPGDILRFEPEHAARDRSAAAGRRSARR